MLSNRWFSSSTALGEKRLVILTELQQRDRIALRRKLSGRMHLSHVPAHHGDVNALNGIGIQPRLELSRVSCQYQSFSLRMISSSVNGDSPVEQSVCLKEKACLLVNEAVSE